MHLLYTTAHISGPLICRCQTTAWDLWWRAAPMAILAVVGAREKSLHRRRLIMSTRAGSTNIQRCFLAIVIVATTMMYYYDVLRPPRRQSAAAAAPAHEKKEFRQLRGKNSKTQIPKRRHKAKSRASKGLRSLKHMFSVSLGYNYPEPPLF